MRKFILWVLIICGLSFAELGAFVLSTFLSLRPKSFVIWSFAISNFIAFVLTILICLLFKKRWSNKISGRGYAIFVAIMIPVFILMNLDEYFEWMYASIIVEFGPECHNQVAAECVLFKDSSYAGREVGATLTLFIVETKKRSFEKLKDEQLSRIGVKPDSVLYDRPIDANHRAIMRTDG